MQQLKQTETDLSSVNSILGAIGQAPISSVYQKQGTELLYVNPEVALIHQLLMEVDRDVQNEGWIFNTEFNFPLLANAEGMVFIPPNVLRMDISEGQVIRDLDPVKRGDRLYDRHHHTYIFPTDRTLFFDITWKWDFDELPSVFQRYITLRASGRAATQMVTNPQLVQLLQTQEAQARASCMEYECNQGDHTYFGTPMGTAYRSYQPYRTLHR
tara:strand:- start:2983 stop:3621 length:639 start_codon:yes stop_codon:yes gene_type:complete